MASEEETEDEGIAVSNRLFAFLILGVALVLIGIVILAVVSAVSSTSTSVGVVIFIGPFPIVFGAGPNATWLVIIGIILAFLSIILFLVMSKRHDWL